MAVYHVSAGMHADMRFDDAMSQLISLAFFILNTDG